MTTASPPTITPLRLRDQEPRPRHTPRDHASVAGIRPRHHANFQQFVDTNRHLFVDYVQRRLRGPHAGAAEDALQEGLIQIWNEWEHWPAEPSERERFAREALRLAALQAIRRRSGRAGSARAGEIIVDFSDLDGPPPAAPAAEALARDLGRAIAEQSLVRDQLSYIEKASLIAAIATLTDLEARVLFMTARGDDCRQIAEDLQISHQQAREALMRARRLCRMLIEHADGQKVSEQEAKLLWQYQDGKLSGKRARELKRHIEHCTACQRLLGLEEAVTTNGALVVLPIPAALLAAGTVTHHAAATTAPTHAPSLGSGTAGHAGTLLTPTAPANWAGSLLSGMTAKTAVALGVAAVAGSIAGTYKAMHDAERHHPLRETLVFHTTVPIHPPAFAAARPASAPRAHRAPRRHHVAKHHRVRRPRTTQVQTGPAPQLASTTVPSASAAPVVATVARTSPAAHSTATASTRRSATRSSGGAGGEFILGSR